MILDFFSFIFITPTALFVLNPFVGTVFFCWFIYFFVLLSKQLKSTFKLFAKWKIKLSNYKHGAKDIRKCMEHEAVGFRNHCATAFPNTLPNTPLRETDNTLPRFKTRHRCLTAKHTFFVTGFPGANLYCG